MTLTLPMTKLFKKILYIFLSPKKGCSGVKTQLKIVKIVLKKKKTSSRLNMNRVQLKNTIKKKI